MLLLDQFPISAGLALVACLLLLWFIGAIAQQRERERRAEQERLEAERKRLELELEVQRAQLQNKQARNRGIFLSAAIPIGIYLITDDVAFAAGAGAGWQVLLNSLRNG